MWTPRPCATSALWWLLGVVQASAAGFDGVVCSSAPTASGDGPIVIGASAALDCCSVNAPYGRMNIQAWQLFTTWLTGRGGVSVGGTRRPIEVRVLDDMSDSTAVTPAYNKHVADGVSLFLGPFGATQCMSAAKVANASGAVLVCPRNPDTSVMKGRPTVFSMTPPFSTYTSCALEALVAKGAKTVAYIAENSSTLSEMCRALTASVPSFGMNLTYSQIVPTDPDRNATAAALAGLKNASADVVVACMRLKGCLGVASEMVASAYFPKAVVLPQCTATPEWDAMGETGLFFTGTTQWLPSMNLTSTLTGWTAQQFAQFYSSAFTAQPNYQAASAFASLEALVVAIEKANSTDPSKVAAQMSLLSLGTVLGLVQFDSNRQLDLKFRAIQTVKANGDLPRTVSPLALADAPIKYPMPSAMERSCVSKVASVFAYDSAGTCVQCPPGYTSIWNDTAGVRTCFFCPPGFVYLGSAKCSACPAGQITIAAGQPQCSNCSPGTYAAAAGQSQCDMCTAGTFVGTAGATECQVCAPGTFNGEVGQSLCRDCIAGTFSTEEAALTCRPCPGGTYAEAGGAAECRRCSGGRVTAELGAWSAGACVCTQGSYAAGDGCAQCPPLQTTPGAGAASRSDCALNPSARAMVAVVAASAVVFPALLWAAWARMQRKLRRAERLRLATLQQQLDSGLKTIREYQHPMVMVSASTFLHLTDEDLQAAHEAARERGLLRTFDTASQVAEYRLRNPACKIVLFSYEWLSWVLKGPNSVQASRMRQALAWYCQKTASKTEDTFVWLDVLSIPQVNAAVQVLAVNSLYTYAASADALIIIAPSSMHEGTGEKANLETYKSRAWTRMELVAQIAAHGLESVYISTESGLEVATSGWIEDIVDIFTGNMTCCRLKHKCQNRCAKESLVSPLLGVWFLLCGGAGPLTNSGAALLHRVIQARIGEVFPAYFAFETEAGTERRPLFGDLIPLLEKHLLQQKQRRGSSGLEAEDCGVLSQLEQQEAGRSQMAWKPSDRNPQPSDPQHAAGGEVWKCEGALV